MYRLVILMVVLVGMKTYAELDSFDRINKSLERFQGEESKFIHENFSAIVNIHIDPEKRDQLGAIMADSSDWVMGIQFYDGVMAVRELSLVAWNESGEGKAYKLYLLHNGIFQSKDLDSEHSESVLNVVNRMRKVARYYTYSPHGEAFFMVCRKKGDGAAVFASNSFDPINYFNAVQAQQEKEDRNWFLDKVVRNEFSEDENEMSVYENLIFGGILEVLSHVSDEETGFFDWFNKQTYIPRNDQEFEQVYDLSWNTKYTEPTYPIMEESFKSKKKDPYDLSDYQELKNKWEMMENYDIGLSCIILRLDTTVNENLPDGVCREDDLTLKKVVSGYHSEAYEYLLEKIGSHSLLVTGEGKLGNRSFTYDYAWNVVRYDFRSPEEASKIGAGLIEWAVSGHDAEDKDRRNWILKAQGLGWIGIFYDGTLSRYFGFDVLGTFGEFIHDKALRRQIFDIVEGGSVYGEEYGREKVVRGLISSFESYPENLQKKVLRSITSYLETVDDTKVKYSKKIKEFVSEKGGQVPDRDFVDYDTSLVPHYRADSISAKLND